MTILLFAIGNHIDHLPPFQRELGPQLHDPSIKFPHTPLEKQQVTAAALWHISAYLSLVLLIPLAFSKSSRIPAPRLLNELWLGLLSSLAFAFVFVCVVKVSVGRLRPDFIARCMPQGGVCTGDPMVIQEGRKSFPSGHSGLSFAGLGFVSLALHAALEDLPTPRLGRIYKVVVALMPWTLALLVALSRIADYWHHWQDILAGAAIGHLAAWVAFRLRFPAPAARLGLLPHVLIDEGGVLASGPKQQLSPPPLDAA